MGKLGFGKLVPPQLLIIFMFIITELPTFASPDNPTAYALILLVNYCEVWLGNWLFFCICCFIVYPKHQLISLEVSWNRCLFVLVPIITTMKRLPFFVSSYKVQRHDPAFGVWPVFTPLYLPKGSLRRIFRLYQC